MNWEANIIRAIQGGGSGFFDIFFIGISFLATIYAVAVIAILLLCFKKYWTTFYFLCCQGVAAIIVKLMKYFIGRPRPYDTYYFIQNIYKADGYSMPSGHSVCAIISVLFLLFMFWRIMNKKTRITTSVIGSILVVLIGFSRMYLGQHYLTDVLSGFCIGYVVCLCAYWLRRPVVNVITLILDKFKWKKLSESRINEAKLMGAEYLVGDASVDIPILLSTDASLTTSNDADAFEKVVDVEAISMKETVKVNPKNNQSSDNIKNVVKDNKTAPKPKTVSTKNTTKTVTNIKNTSDTVKLSKNTKKTK